MSAAGLHFAVPVSAVPVHRAPVQPAPRASECAGSPRPWLCWAFTFFNSARVFAYLPTLWAIHVNGDSSQHSLWTWLTWFGANVTMAAWLHERGNGQVNRAVLVNVVNALMCAGAVVLILWYRR